MIKVTVNGRDVEIEPPVTITRLLENADVPPNYLAVEINGEVVPREQHESHLVAEGDEIEVVTLVGGG